MVVDRQFWIVADAIVCLETLFETSISCIEGRLPALQILLQSIGFDALQTGPLASKTGRIMAN